MYEVKNLRTRQTTLALPGKGIVLTRRGRKGDSALILDREKDDPAVQALVKAKAIRISRTSHGETPDTPVVKAELQRIAATNSAHERAAIRARGEVPSSNPVAKKRSSKRKED